MKQWEVSKGPHNNKGNLSAFVMRNSTPGPKFSPLVAAVILITFAVWPIGHAKAETFKLADNQKEKILNEEDTDQKTMHSLMNVQDHVSNCNEEKPVYYKKWDRDLQDEDLQYSPQLEPASGGAGFYSYESDGYGYDDDEYDHLNYKRFDSNKDNYNQNDKISKDSNLLQKNPVLNDGKMNLPLEVTTIELLNFHAKNLNPEGEITLSAREESTVKNLLLKKPAFPGKELQDPLLLEKLKKKNGDEQKANDMKPAGSEGNDKNSGNNRKVSEIKENLEKSDKSKSLETITGDHLAKQDMKVTDVKGNGANINDGKKSKCNDLSRSEGKIAENDVKNSDTNLKNDGNQEKNTAKIKEGKEADSTIKRTEIVKDVKEEEHGKDMPHFVGSQTNFVGSEYKDGFDNMNTAGITDDEKASEDLKENEMNLAGLRDNRNELPYKYKDPMNRFRSSNYVKKDASDEYLTRKIGSRSSLEPASDWDATHALRNDVLAKNSLERASKEPFHLDFPLTDLENTDYHRNFIKSLKRYKGLDESSRILSQGDTPSPFADDSKQRLASRVIEEEQRKRRSRLRRLKTSPIFAPAMRKRIRERPDSFNGYTSERNYDRPYKEDGLCGRGMEDCNEIDFKTYPGLYNRPERGFSDDETEVMDSLGDGDTFDEDEDEDEDLEMTSNVKNKRQNSPGHYKTEWDSDAELDDEEDGGLVETESERIITLPEKNPNKPMRPVNELVGDVEKKKCKDYGLYQEPLGYNPPLLLLHRNDIGKQSLKTFTNGRYKNEDERDSGDFARLLTRDSNYVLLKKIPKKDQVQKIFDSESGEERGKAKNALDNQTNKEKYRFSQLNLAVKANNPKGEDAEVKKIFRSYKECHGDQLPKQREDRAKDLKDIFKENDREKELSEKKEMLDGIEDHLNELQKGEPDKNLIYKPSLTQTYRHIKEFEISGPANETEIAQAQGYNEKKIEDSNNSNQVYMSPEKSFKKDGKEVILFNRPYNSILYKTKNQETVAGNLTPHTIPVNNIASNVIPISSNPLPSATMYACHVAPISNLPQNINPSSTGNVPPRSNSMTDNYMVPNFMPSNMMQNGLLPNNNVMQIKVPEVGQKPSDNNRRYFLLGSENDVGNAPKHEVRILQRDFNPSQNSNVLIGNTLTPQQSTYSLENYNKPNQNAQKNTQTGKVQPFVKSENLLPEQQGAHASADSGLQKPNPYYDGNGGLKCMVNAYQRGAAEKRYSSLMKNMEKHISKKDNRNRYLSGNLKRFMRDFQNFDRGYQSNKIKDTSGMSLRELTSHGGKHLQRLNSLLKDIIGNKVQVNDGAARKNVKRGMCANYMELKKRQPEADSSSDSQGRSAKWTSVVYNGSNRMGFFRKNDIASRSDMKGSSTENKLINDLGTSKNLYSKKKKRESPYDSAKASTKNLEVKVKTMPYAVEMQPLNPGILINSNSNNNNNNNRQQKSNSKAFLTLPPDKLMDLLNFIQSDREEKIDLEAGLDKNALCRRETPFLENPHPPPFRRKLMSMNEEPKNAANYDKKEDTKISLIGYLDPPVQKTEGCENKSMAKTKRSVHTKREIDLDESMPNDFQNFLMTSLGGFGNQKREIVKKEEAFWEKERTHEDPNQIVDGTNNREPNEESTLGKRDTSENTKKSQKQGELINGEEEKIARKENEATNIRIRIVDGNANGELSAKASEESGTDQLTSKSKTETEKSGVVTGSEKNANVHEVYLIADADSKRMKKDKLATSRSDRTPQNGPVTSHTSETETVYNPSPGGNKAQINSNEGQTKIKYLDKTNICNGTASAAEDGIIQDNLRTGNINTFTYQRNEEPITYPLRSLTNPPSSSEFEMLDSKNPPRSKPFAPRQMIVGSSFAASSLIKNNPEIIYKDEANMQYLNNIKALNSKFGYASHIVPHMRNFNSAMKGRPYMKGPENPNLGPFQKNYAEEYVEYCDPEETGSFSETPMNHRTGGEYDFISGREKDSGILSREIKEDHICEKSMENLNPKMIEMWKNYAKTHLTPASHKEAMNREFEEAYSKSNQGGKINFKSGTLGNVPWGKYNAGNQNRCDYGHLAIERGKNREKLGKRLTKTKRSDPIQIGQRFFYTFKTEVPDAEYYNLITEPDKLKSSGGNTKVNWNDHHEEKEKSKIAIADNARLSGKIKERTADIVKRGAEALDWSYIVHKTESNEKIGRSEPGARRKRFMEVHQAGNDLGGNRVKRFQSSTKSADESKVMEKRFSPGHLTESHFRKHHRKNFRAKREAKFDEIRKYEFDSCPRAKRDAIADSVNEEMVKRMLQEKKAKTMIKNLKVELATGDVPFMSQREVAAEELLTPQNLQKLKEDENFKRKILEEKPKLADQQDRNTVKSGMPDFYKTFEIKRGGRAENEKVHIIVSRSEPEMYRDMVFLKGANAHKVRKIADEGFEALTPDLRFSEKSSLNFYVDREKKAAARESTKTDETVASSVVNRKTDDKSKVKNGGSEPKQKMTHGFSHEAPLLAPANPLNSPRIFESLKDDSSNELKAFKFGNEVILAGATLGKSGNLQNPPKPPNLSFKSAKLTDESKKKDPLIGAVLVLAKRDRTRKRHAQSGYSPHRERKSRKNRSNGKEYGGGYNLKKRNIDDRVYSEKFDRLPEIVNDDSRCRSCGSESQTKSRNNNKQKNSFKHSSFSFSQLPNMKTDRNENERRGEDIIESILGRVESNPHFRKVIGPGLKWRGRKCYSEDDVRHQSNSSPSNKSNFVRQVRKILAKFAYDIEKLALQDSARDPCSKLDGGSRRFLHELLDVPYQPKSEGKQNNFQVDSFTRYENKDQGGKTNSSTSDAAYMDREASIEAMLDRRKLVLELLEEYQKLSDCEKEKVEVLGQYLMHELDILNNALNVKNEGIPECSPSNTVLPTKQEETSTSPAVQSTDEVQRKVTCATEWVQSTEKDQKRGTVKLPFIWSNLEDLKLLKPGHSKGANCPSSIANIQIPIIKDSNLFPFHTKEAVLPTEISNVADPKISFPNMFFKNPLNAENRDNLSFRGNSVKNECYPGKNVGQLDKLGYGDAAGLQLSLKTHAPWLSNLNLGKEKTIGAMDNSKSLAQPFEANHRVTDLPYNSEFPEMSVDVPQSSAKKNAFLEDNSNEVHDVDYQEYEEDDNYQGLKPGESSNLSDKKTFLSLDSR